ncbi:DUF2231 domain-containing protein [Candidatus Parcubacteria bacterium]|nr:MAG: DUF2231 domain-containing protein [Candidatus Parcubacteria bacterium]
MESDFIAGLHPNIVHFPITLLSTYAVLEITAVILNNEFISKSALLLLCLGVISALFAVFSGNQAFAAYRHWNEQSENLLNEHQSYATILLWFSVLVCALRIFFAIKKKITGFIKFVFILFAIIILYLVYETGERGGNLVSKFGVGTELIFQEKVKP